MTDESHLTGQAIAARVARGASTPQTWATASARDWKNGKASQETMERNSRPLNEQVAHSESKPGSLSPDWVELLMGWPLRWTALVAPDMVDFEEWLMRNREDHLGAQAGDAEDVRAVRKADDAEALQGDAREQSGVLSSEVLRSKVCERPDGDRSARVALEGAETPRESVCGVRDDDGTPCPPCRQGHHEPDAREPTDALHPLSQVPSRYGQAAWYDGSWEAGIARVAIGVPSRVDRLRALGNGQVPQCMAAAFTYLAREAGILP